MDLIRVIIRQWRPGWRSGRRLTRLPPPRPSPVPLYSLGTAARIDRLRSWYAEEPAIARPCLSPCGVEGRLQPVGAMAGGHLALLAVIR